MLGLEPFIKIQLDLRLAHSFLISPISKTSLFKSIIFYLQLNTQELAIHCLYNSITPIKLIYLTPTLCTFPYLPPSGERKPWSVLFAQFLQPYCSCKNPFVKFTLESRRIILNYLPPLSSFGVASNICSMFLEIFSK